MVSFNSIPANVRVGLFFAEVDGSLAGRQDVFAPALLVGQMLGTGTATPDTPVLVTSVEQAKTLFGQGSMLALMMQAYRNNDSFGEVWALPLEDASAGVAATGEIVITGTATEAGTLNVYVAGARVQVAVASGDAAADVAAATAAAIQAAKDLPVTAAATGGDVALTAKHTGELGNDIDVRLNHFGAPGGEATPAGLTVAVTGMASGTTNPVLTDAFAALGDEPYDFIAFPYTDTTSLNALDTELGEITGRWAWDRQVYGHAFGALRGTVSALGTFGNARNGPHVSILGFPQTRPSSAPAHAAALAAQAAVALRNDPARPLQTLPLAGIVSEAPEERFTLSERNVLLYDGIATTRVDDAGTVRVERIVTTYQTNTFGDPDTAWLDVQTPATLTVFLREMRGMIQTTFPRMKLVADADRLSAGQAAVSPRQIRGAIIAKYGELERRGLVENADAFAESLIVEKSATDPNRVDVLAKPDLVNQLRIVAMRAQFLLDPPTAA